MFKGAEPFVILGSGRGGTTWILELICSDPAYRLMFEPLHELKVPESEPFSYRYYRKDYSSKYTDTFFQKVFSGKLTNEWTQSRPWKCGSQGKMSYKLDILKHILGDFKSRLVSSRLAVKFIRGNLMAPWFDSRFGATILFVTRSPLDICSSMVRTGWFKNHLEFGYSRYLTQDELVQDYLSDHIDWMRKVGDPLERAAIMWVVENMVPLSGEKLQSMTVVPYEYMIHYGVPQFRALFDSTGLKINFDERMISKPSSRSVDGKRFEKRPDDGMDKRGRQIVPEVMERFGFDLYNADGSVNEDSPYYTKWDIGRFNPGNSGA